MHRVAGRLLQADQRLHAAVEVACALVDGVEQGGARQVVPTPPRRR
jgi:hypothetical protein